MKIQVFDFALIAGLLVQVHAHAQNQGTDEPNLRIEQRLDRIYKTYNQTPTDDQLWDSAQKQSGKHSYTLQKGDTLWDTSEMMFGDPNFWPKVWSLNKNILDPHLVSPGAELAFSTGTTEEAPSVEVNTEKSMPPEVIPEVLALTANVELPPPRHETPPPSGEVPSSLPFWKYKPNPNMAMRFEVQPVSRPEQVAVKYISFFAADRAIQSVGEVVGTEGNLNSAAEFQYLFVKLTSATAGSKVFSVQKELPMIQDPETSKTGHLIQVQGEIEILEPVNASENLYRAFVRKNLSLIEKGSKLVAQPLPTMSFSADGPQSSIAAKVCWGHFGGATKMFGTDSLLVLNKGAAAGLAEGQILPIYQQMPSRNTDIHLQMNPRKIGTIRVVKLSEQFATAVVLQEIDHINMGDTTAPNNAIASVSAQAGDLQLDGDESKNDAGGIDATPGELNLDTPNDSGGAGDGSLEATPPNPDDTAVPDVQFQ